jgi:hypothetical protein
MKKKKGIYKKITEALTAAQRAAFKKQFEDYRITKDLSIK